MVPSRSAEVRCCRVVSRKVIAYPPLWSAAGDPLSRVPRLAASRDVDAVGGRRAARCQSAGASPTKPQANDPSPARHSTIPQGVSMVDHDAPERNVLLRGNRLFLP